MKRTIALLLAVAMCFSLAASPVAAAQEDHSADSSSYADQSTPDASATKDEKDDKSSAKDEKDDKSAAKAEKDDKSSAKDEKDDQSAAKAEKDEKGDDSNSLAPQTSEESSSSASSSSSSSSASSVTAQETASTQEPEHSDASSSASSSATSSASSSSAAAEAEPEPHQHESSPAEAEVPEKSSEPAVEQPEQPETVIPVQEDLKTIQTSLKTVDGVTYTLTLSYGEEAGIPDNAKLSIVELNQALTEEEQQKKENEKRPYDTERFVSEKALEQDSFDLRQGLKVRKKDYVLFTKFLDLSLTANGKEVQPKAPVTVTLETDVVEEGASGALEAAFYDKAATEKWTKERETLVRKQKEQLRTGKLKQEDAERFPERVFTPVKMTNETEKDKGVRLSFQLEEFDQLGVTGVVKRLKAWKVKGEQVCVYGPRSLKAKVHKESLKTPKAGLEKLRAFSVEPNEKEQPKYDVTFWVGGVPEQYEKTDGQLTVMDADGDPEAGIVACELKSSGKAGHTLIGTAGTDAPVAIKPGKRVGLLWDTGLREQSVEADNVSVEGMLPKNAQLTANDMLWRYSRPEEVVESVGKDAETLAAYDITISGKQGEFQPEDGDPVSVSIQDESISSRKNLEVWHLKDDDTVEVIRNFEVRGDTLSFDAEGFSVYMVVQITKEQTLTASDGNQYKVTVTYDTDSGIPEDAQLQVSELTAGKRYNRYVKKAAKALKKERTQLSYAHAFDIALVNPETGAHYQPTKPLTVRVELFTEDVKQGDSLSVVHFGEKTEVLDSRVNGEAVEFETDGFSVYIVAREDLLQHFKFLNDTDGNLNDTNQDNYIHSEQALVDGETLVRPSDAFRNGSVFQHWSAAQNEDTAVTFPQTVHTDEAAIRSAAAAQLNISEADVTQVQMQTYLNAHPTYFYAVYTSNVTVVTFYNQSGLVVEEVKVTKPAAGQSAVVYDTTAVDYVPIQDKEGSVLTFDYWTEDPQGAGEQAGANGKLSIDSNSPARLDLFPRLTNGHYLYLDANKKRFGLSSAEFTSPEAVADGKTAGQVCASLNSRGNHAIPTSNGYQFTGWFIRSSGAHDNDEDVSTRTVPVFYPNDEGTQLLVNVDEYNKLLNSGNLPNNPTLYAHWKVVADSSYTIVVWGQNARDASQYDYLESVTAKPVQTGVGASTTFNGTDYAAGLDAADFPEFQSEPVRIERSSPTVAADGSTVVNIYYDRKEVTITFKTWQSNYTYTETTGSSTPQYGWVNDQYVPLTRGAATTTYSYTRNTYTQYTGTSDGEYYIVENGTYSTGTVHLYRFNGVWYRSKATLLLVTRYSNPYYGNVYTLNKTGQPYTADRYTKSGSTYTKTNKDGSGLYGLDNHGNYVPLTAASQSTYPWTYNGSPYTGKRYTRSTGTSNQWTTYKTLTGLYGQTFSDIGMEWPTKVGSTNYSWYENGHGAGGNFGTGYQDTDGDGDYDYDSYYYINYQGGHTSGMMMTFMDAFLPSGGGDTGITFYGESNSDSDAEIVFLKQKTDLNGYDTANTISTGKGRFSITDKYTGFKAVSYRVNGSESWTKLSAAPNASGYYATGISYSSMLEIRFDRREYELIFSQNYTGSSSIRRDLAYGRSLSDSGALPAPTRSGYLFTGWYYDKSLTRELTQTEFETLTMPANNLTFYAGWVQVKNRVVLIPNGGALAEKQGVQFHLDPEQAEKISLDAEPTRDYVPVTPGTGTHTYDSVKGQYSLTQNNDGDYSAKAGAYQFQGWYEADMGGEEPKLIVYGLNESGKEKYAYAYGDYQPVADGEDGAYTYDAASDTYTYVKTGGTHKFVNSAPRTDDNGNYLYGNRFDMSSPPNRPVILIARWQRVGSFRVQYQVEDPALPNLDYAKIVAPEDTEEYLDGSHALVLPAINAPENYTLDYWTDQNWTGEGDTAHQYRANDLLSIVDGNASPQPGSSNMMVTLTAHYREFNPNKRMMADYVFMVREVNGALTDFVSTSYKEYERQTIAVGEELKAPLTPPVPAGWRFRGWYYESQGNYRFDGFGVVANPSYTTVYALYDKVYTVTYYLTDTATMQHTETVLATQTYSADGTSRLDSRRITNPVDEDHYVEAWVKDTDWDNRENLSTHYPYNAMSSKTVTGDMRLYALMRAREYVEFDSQGGTFVDTQEIPAGGRPVMPEEPSKTGFEFAGWWTAAVGGTLYDFDIDLNTTNYPDYNGTLYAHWDATTDAKGTLHVIFWAQTADRPENDADAAADTEHYQMLYRTDIDVSYGTHTAAELQSQLAEFVDGGQYSIVKTATTAKGDAASKEAAESFLVDALGYKGKNSHVNTSVYNPLDQEHINELTNYYQYSAKNGASVNVDGSDDAVLNIYFDLKVFYLEFSPKFTFNGTKNSAEIHYNGKTYPHDAASNWYRIPVWLNRPIADLWPIDRTDETGDLDDSKAYLIWKDSSSHFYSWNLWTYEYPKKTTTLTKTDNERHRTPLNLSDKLVIDAILEKGSDDAETGSKVLPVKPDRVSSNDAHKAYVHYLIQDGAYNTFTELTELRSYLYIQNPPSGSFIDYTATTTHTSDSNYKRFAMCYCTIHKYDTSKPYECDTVDYSNRPSHSGVVFAYSNLEPVSLSGYTMLNNELAHKGDLIDPNTGTWDDGVEDNKNSCMRFNLILDWIGKPQVIFDKNDPAYQSYFKYHQDQYVDEAGVYNLYFYYKPEQFQLDFYTDSATQYKDENKRAYAQMTYCNTNLNSILASIPAPDAPDEYHYFAGWATAPFVTNPGDDLRGKGTTMPAHNLTLYAIWAPVTHKVTTLGVDNNGTYFLACTDPADTEKYGKEVDEDGNLVANGKESAVYSVSHGQQLKELKLRNPTRSDYLFTGWINNKTDITVTGVYEVKEDLYIRPGWQDLTTRRVEYDANGGEGTVPVDNNKYIIGAKVILKDGKALKIVGTDIMGQTYDRTFAYWEDESGNRYYPNSTYIFRESSPEVLKLKAVYSEFRETILTYHKNDDDAVFIKDDGSGSAYTALTELESGEKAVRVLFRDMRSQGFNSENDMIPNQTFKIGKDQYGDLFTVKRTVDGNDYHLVGWATSPDSTMAVALNGDTAYVNTILEDGALKNDLYAVWGICKVVDLDSKEHVFDTISKAVSFIEQNGKINGKQVGRLENKTGKVEMLVDYTMGSTVEPQVTIPAGCTVTLSTAGKLGSYGKPRTAPEGERLFYEGTGDRATIIRGSGNAGSLFVVNGNFTTEKIILDGGAVFDLTKWDTKSSWPNTGLTPNGDGFTGGGIAYVAANAALTISKGTVMQNSDATSSGQKKGGAVYCLGTVSVSGDASDGKDSVLIQNCKADEGGGIYTTQVELTVSNATFKYCRVKNGGGGIRHENKSDSTKTIVSNCQFDSCYSSEKTNKQSGSGIRTNTAEFRLTDSDFAKCKSGRQGGAVFHIPKDSDSTASGTVTYVSGCSFSHCEAGYLGSGGQGAGGALEASGADVDVISSTFTDCKALSNAGALNIYNTKAEITLNGCSFRNCTANLTNSGTGTGDAGYGGAFRTTGSKTDITDCTFENCHASKGGAICCNGGSNVTTITMTDSAEVMIKDCTAKYYGGALFQLAGTLKINSGSIQNCSAPNGGAIYQGGGTFNFEGGTISGCSAAKVSYGEVENKLTVSLGADSGTTYNGGGVYLGDGTFKMEGTGGTISQCKAVSSGGGVYLGKGTFTMSSGLIDQCVAKTGGGVSAHKGATMTINKSGDAITNCHAKNVTLSGTTVTVADSAVSGNHGGGIYLDGGSPTINSTIRDCSAYDGGGLYLSGTGTLVMGTNASVIDGCTATNSGAGIYQSAGTLTINSGKLKGNRATASGGGIYLGGGTFTINGGEIGCADESDGKGGTVENANKAKNGAGIYQGGGELTMKNGSIRYNVATEKGGGIYLGGGSFDLEGGVIGGLDSNDEPTDEKNTAQYGGGLYVANGKDKDHCTSASIKGGIIGGNHASVPGGGGGIYPGGEYVRLYFEGSIQVWGNTMEPTEKTPHQKHCDVCLDFDSNDIIRTTSTGLSEASHIGVYVTDKQIGEQILHDNLHGTTGLPFGTFENRGSGDNCLSRFINNRSGRAYDGYEYYYGVRKPEAEDPQHRIYWADYVCEITDAQGNLLFTNNKATAPALYQYLDKYGAFEALENHTTFYTKDRAVYTGTTFYVRMLVFDYSLRWPESVTVSGSHKITLTMADKEDENLPDAKKAEYDVHDGCTTIRRGNCTQSMFDSQAGSEFTLNHVTLDGGATYNESTKTLSGTSVSANGGLIKAGGTLTLDTKTVLQNSLTTGGGAIAVEQSKQNVTITVGETAKIQHCKAENGGLLYVADNGGTVSFTNNGSLEGITATNGGYVYVQSGTLNLYSGFTGGEATSGGQLYVNGGALNLKSGSFTGGKATNGGCAYVNGGTLQIANTDSATLSDHEATEKGGGVYVGNGGTFRMKNGSINGNRAKTGAGIFVDAGGSLSFDGHNGGNVKVTGNTASVKGGGIAVGGDTARLNFKNLVTVTGNTMPDPKQTDKVVECNVYLDCDSNEVIRFDSYLSSASKIGVYTSDDALTGGGTVRSKHGTTGKPFGTWTQKDNKPSNLKCFVNDRSPYLYGVYNVSDSSDKKIYWVTFVCKITAGGDTEAERKLLYKKLSDGSYSPAVYAQLGLGSNKYGPDCAFNALLGDSSKPEELLYTKDGETYTAYTTNDYWIQMLVPEYTWRKYINVNKNVTFTTASTKEDEEGFCYSGDEEHPYATIIRSADITDAQQKRASMITVRGNLILKDIILDGNNVLAHDGDPTQNPANGAIIQLKNDSSARSLTIGENASLINGYTTGNGGAVWADKSGQTINVTGGTIKGNRAAQGAGIYAGSGVTLNLSGGIDFGGDGRKGGTGEDQDDLNGTLAEGNFVLMADSEAGKPYAYTATDADKAKNGGKAYPTDAEAQKYLVRQDICLVGNAETLNTLHVTGKLTDPSDTTDDPKVMPAGSIWVWAVDEKHYKADKQFAVVDDAYKNQASASELEEVLKAFRNAQADSITENPNEEYYLYGLTGTGQNVVWGTEPTGSVRVILKKVGANQRPIDNAEFTLYKKDQSTIVEVKKEDTSEKLENKSAGASGVFWIGDLPYGTYYLHETAPSDRWFYLVVDGNFQSMSGEYSTKDGAKTAGDAESTAVSWASKIISGKKIYSDVPSTPSSLKNRVKELLNQSGHSNKVS